MHPMIDQTADFVKQTLKDAEAGHDWWHILRVWNNAKLIGQSEQADMLVVELAALLHDIADSSFITVMKRSALRLPVNS